MTTYRPSIHAELMSQHNDAAARLPWHRRVLTTLVVLAVLVSGWATTSPAEAAHGWAWPVKPKPAIARGFQPPPRKWLSGHRGVDLSTTPGTLIRSPATGTVAFTGWVVDRAVITIDHGGGLKSSFEPVNPSVKQGDVVARGQILGTVAGVDHCPPSGCVHWGVRRNGDYVNPLQFVQDMRPSVLLPVQ